jgi:hypothetical protein
MQFFVYIYVQEHMQPEVCLTLRESLKTRPTSASYCHHSACQTHILKVLNYSRVESRFRQNNSRLILHNIGRFSFTAFHKKKQLIQFLADGA